MKPKNADMQRFSEWSGQKLEFLRFIRTSGVGIFAVFCDLGSLLGMKVLPSMRLRDSSVAQRDKGCGDGPENSLQIWKYSDIYLKIPYNFEKIQTYTWKFLTILKIFRHILENSLQIWKYSDIYLKISYKFENIQTYAWKFLTNLKIFRLYLKIPYKYLSLKIEYVAKLSHGILKIKILMSFKIECVSTYACNFVHP